VDKAFILKEASDSIVSQDLDKAREIAEQTLTKGYDPMEVIEKGFTEGISRVGDSFERGELFLPELIQAGEAMKVATDILNAAVPSDNRRKKGRYVIATVEGDVHDIGKGIVVSMLKAHGFEVFDIGRDVSIDKIIDSAIEVGADIIGTSALLTTTLKVQQKLEEKLKSRGIRNNFKTMVGGAPCTERWAKRIGADAYAEDAHDAVKKAVDLLIAN